MERDVMAGAVGVGCGWMRGAGRKATSGVLMLALTCGLGGVAGLMGGCGLFKAKTGTAATPLPGQYAGLKDKTLAIVVYVQPATIDEYAGTREEITAFVTKQLRVSLPTVRLVDPREVIAWQNSTLNWYGLSEREIGEHFSVDRVLFIEVLEYSTKKVVGYSDLQGHLRALCKVTEVEGGAKSPAWSGVVDVAWPSARALDPTQTNDGAARLRTLEVFADRLVGCFAVEEARSVSAGSQ